MFSTLKAPFLTIYFFAIWELSASVSSVEPTDTQELAFNRDTVLDRLIYKSKLNHENNKLSNFVKRSEPVYTSPDKPAAVYDTIPCPTLACSCTRDTDQTPPMKQINCRFRDLTTIPHFRQVDLTYDELTFGEGNNIRKIPYAAFHLLRVKHIKLQNNNIEEVSDGAFVGLENVLEKLDLQGNGALFIPYNKLSNLKSLVELRLYNFGDDTIPLNNKFESFEKLEILEFYQMKNLFAIEMHAFSNKLPMLHSLAFDDVDLNEIPVNALQQLDAIKKLKISRSNIWRIYAQNFTGGNLQQLTEIDLSNNEISVLDQGAFDKVCMNLVVLDLTINKLSDLTSLKTKNWPKLEVLNLSYNYGIGSLSTNVFRNMPNLQYLNLMSVNIQIISRTTFTGLANLHTLALSYNRIEYIHEGSFIPTHRLKELRLGYQHFDSRNVSPISPLDLSPSVIQGITTSLTRLDVSNTILKAGNFWKTIKILPNLEELEAKQSGISYIPDNTFSNSSRLQYITLENNTIKSLSNLVFIGLENSLRSLNLRSNNIITVNECVFKRFNLSTIELDLAGNSLHCDCQLIWLHELITLKLKQDPYYLTSITCRTPERLNGISLKNVSLDQLNCPDSKEATCYYSTEATTMPTSLTTTPVPSSSIAPSPTPVPASLTLYIGASTKTSLTFYWGTKGIKGLLHGFNIEYHAAVDDRKISAVVGPGTKEYTITGLKPGLSYIVCVSAKSSGTNMIKSCKSRETLAEEGQTQGFKDDSNQNTVIVILVTSVIVVVLIIAGMYMLVKYKIQKLREMRLTLTSPGLPRRDDPAWDMCSREDSSSCANEYVIIKNTKQLKEAYKKCNDKELYLQHARENPYKDRYYSTYRKHKKNRNKDDMETDNEQNEDNTANVVYTEVGEQQKSDLETRHSAPSRLNAADLRKSGRDRNSRPLPATPIESVRQAKEGKEEMNAKTKNVFMTQASVYEPKSPGKPPLSKTRDSIYYEIEASDIISDSEHQ